jgi:hypothetical protein
MWKRKRCCIMPLLQTNMNYSLSVEQLPARNRFKDKKEHTSSYFCFKNNDNVEQGLRK